MKKILFFFLFTIIISSNVKSQKRGEREVIKISATVSTTPAQIHLKWLSKPNVSGYNIYRRSDLDTAKWGTPVKVNMAMDTTYTDSDVEVGKGYEYQITAISTQPYYGYVYSGISKTAEHYMGTVLLVIDETYKTALSVELDRLENDLQNEGWNVRKIYTSRTQAVSSVKDDIDNEARALSGNLKSIFIIGHVPVPYSGDYGGDLPPPDGHVVGSGGHTGAWSADTYYACFDGTWTDARVNNTTGSRSRNHNTVGDGKLDQSRLPGNVNYEIGRVDLFDMPSFSESDTELVRNYLNRNHAYRTGQTQTVKRALVDDNFGSLNLSSTGWHNFTAIYPPDSVFAKDYFDEMKNKPYQWSYGCGAGSYTSCNGIGKTTDFASDSLQSIFTILAGSYFGDWDIRNNLLKAPLANSALVSFWGGIPKWYVHTMALGKNIGFGTRESMNNRGDYYTGFFNNSHNSAHMALMGDPTLKLNYIQAPKNLSGESKENTISLKWDAAPGLVDGYHVYEVETFQSTNYQKTEKPLTSLTYVDSTKKSQGKITYMVRAVKYDTTNSGTYEILSPGIFVDIEHTYDPYLTLNTQLLENQVKTYPNPATNKVQVEWPIQNGNSLSIKLLDMNGRVVYQKAVHQDYYTEFLINNVPKGMYILHLQSEDLTSNKILTIAK